MLTILLDIFKILCLNVFQTQYTDGEVVLTTHRILWGKPGDIPKGLVCLSLYLYYVFCIEEESGGVFGLGGPKRIILHLGPTLPGNFNFFKYFCSISKQ